jgi:hypothetical protein
MRRGAIIILGLLVVAGATGRERLIVGAERSVVTIEDRRDTIPLGGNAWRGSLRGSAVGDSAGGYIDNNGIGGWTDSAVFFDVWIRTAVAGSLRIWIGANVLHGGSRLMVEAGGSGAVVQVYGGGPAQDAGIGSTQVGGIAFRYYDAGVFTLRDSGYQRIRIRGISRTGAMFADIPSIVVQGSAIDGRTAFVPNNEGNFFHWGRRGPSVHLNYSLPADFNATWFYNEITVPAGQDVKGSYFMACGFAQGYFGMQVNSARERHILFSVWSPFETDDPASIPDSQRIVLLKKGDKVHTGEFGHEGSGGQSYLNYPWKAGRTYRFLLHSERGARRQTVFTAWWWAPETGKWQLIASFRRPETGMGLTRLHSFLENFEPETGNIGRMAFYDHARAGDSTGHWISLNRAIFTVDNTGRKGYRMDFAGGAEEHSFFLKNDGFFNSWTAPGTLLEHRADSGNIKLKNGQPI